MINAEISESLLSNPSVCVCAVMWVYLGVIWGVFVAWGGVGRHSAAWCMVARRGMGCYGMAWDGMVHLCCAAQLDNATLHTGARLCRATLSQAVPCFGATAHAPEHTPEYTDHHLCKNMHAHKNAHVHEHEHERNTNTCRHESKFQSNTTIETQLHTP